MEHCERVVSDLKDMVEDYAARFSRQDWPGLVSLMTEDAERREAGVPGSIRGRKDIERDMAPSPDISSMRMEVARMVEEGSLVVAEGSVRLTKRDGGVIHVLFCNLFEFQGKKIRRVTSYSAVEGSPA